MPIMLSNLLQSLVLWKQPDLRFISYFIAWSHLSAVLLWFSNPESRSANAWLLCLFFELYMAPCSPYKEEKKIATGDNLTPCKSVANETAVKHQHDVLLRTTLGQPKCRKRKQVILPTVALKPLLFMYLPLRLTWSKWACLNASDIISAFPMAFSVSVHTRRFLSGSLWKEVSTSHSSVGGAPFSPIWICKRELLMR